MNKLVITLCMATCLLSSSVQSMLTAEQAVEVIAGIMDGVILKDDLKELKECMKDT